MPGQHLARKHFADPARPIGQRLSYAERVQIHTLYSKARWSATAIAKDLKIARSTIQACIKSGYTTPRKAIGRPAKLTTRKRGRLIKKATTDAFHRRMTLEEIAHIEGIQACRRTLFKAFEKEGYFRRVAAEKPLLTEAQTRARLEWAKKHKDWDFDMWKRVLWTDEAAFRTGGFGSIYITRKAEEKYDHSCIVPKFRKHMSWMAHGCISGTSKGPLLVFEKDWNKVTAAVYSERVLPGVYSHMRYGMKHEGGFMRAILMEDNAAIHKANLTKAYHAYYGAIYMTWPANSPDLNPIENVWRLLKHRIGKRFPHTEEEVRRFLEEEWAALKLEDFVHYIKEMPQRVQAVIDAEGGHTKW